MPGGRGYEQGGKDDTYGERWAIPGQETELPGKCKGQPCATAPELEYGRQNKHRQRHADEQGAGDHRGQMALWAG